MIQLSRFFKQMFLQSGRRMTTYKMRKTGIGNWRLLETTKTYKAINFFTKYSHIWWTTLNGQIIRSDKSDDNYSYMSSSFLSRRAHGCFARDPALKRPLKRKSWKTYITTQIHYKLVFIFEFYTDLCNLNNYFKMFD